MTHVTFPGFQARRPIDCYPAPSAKRRLIHPKPAQVVEGSCLVALICREQCLRHNANMTAAVWVALVTGVLGFVIGVLNFFVSRTRLKKEQDQFETRLKKEQDRFETQLKHQRDSSRRSSSYLGSRCCLSIQTSDASTTQT